MPSYTVTWKFDIEADEPKKAAEFALRVQRDHSATATVFEVTDQETGDQYHIDLHPLEF